MAKDGYLKCIQHSENFKNFNLIKIKFQNKLN